MSKLAQAYFKEMGWKFHLQGSRSKGFCTPESDWDYFLDADEQAAQKVPYGILFKEWSLLVDESYADASTKFVFEKTFPDGRVQVSCRKNYSAVAQAWDAIPVDFYGKYLCKRSESCLGRDFVKGFMNYLYFSATSHSLAQN